MGMKFIDLSTDEERVRSIYRVVGYTSLIVFIVLGISGIVLSVIDGIDVFGVTYVTTEIPPLEWFGFGAKPISWLYLTGVLLLYSTLNLNKKNVFNLPRQIFHAVKMFAFAALSLSLYEIAYNFTLWGSLMASSSIVGHLNPDLLMNTFPNPSTPVNLVFATKMFIMLTILSGYYLYFVERHAHEFKP